MDGRTLSHVQSCGREYTQTQDPTILQDAATIAACATDSERKTLRFYWEEGVRNYSAHMGEYRRLMADYDNMVAEL